MHQQFGGKRGPPVGEELANCASTEPGAKPTTIPIPREFGEPRVEVVLVRIQIIAIARPADAVIECDVAGIAEVVIHGEQRHVLRSAAFP